MNNPFLMSLVLIGGVIGEMQSSFADMGALCEDELSVAVDEGKSVIVQSIDLRNRWPVETLGRIELPYSAVGWDFDSHSVGATVRLNLQDGKFFGESFSPGLENRDLATGLTDKGVFTWRPHDVGKNAYRILHETTQGGRVVDSDTFFAYFDFSDCDVVSEEEFRDVVLGAITQPISVRHDDLWQPIDIAVLQSGVTTDEWLAPGDEAVMAFTFKWRGVLHFDYNLTGGMLGVFADGEIVSNFTEDTAGWLSCRVPFAGCEAHELTFVYTAVGGSVAEIRNVRWEYVREDECARSSHSNARIDLQNGEVRTPKKLAQVLPFVYSPTNFTGTVDGTASRVSIVQLTGDDPDVTKWTEEIPGTYKVLKTSPDEGEVIWRAKKGVWKATFEIFDGEGLKETLIKYFDLRKAKGNGLVLFVT